jgi:sulfide:quinone oxidoreductase
LEAARKWKEFLKDPEPIVLGSIQYASCFGAEYEIAFNIDLALRQAGIRERAPITFITSEPFVGHFGIGGMGKGQEMIETFFSKLKINWITNAVTEKITPEHIYLSSGDESDNIQ